MDIEVVSLLLGDECVDPSAVKNFQDVHWILAFHKQSDAIEKILEGQCTESRSITEEEVRNIVIKTMQSPIDSLWEKNASDAAATSTRNTAAAISTGNAGPGRTKTKQT
jgi:hypothetical protein